MPNSLKKKLSIKSEPDKFLEKHALGWFLQQAERLFTYKIRKHFETKTAFRSCHHFVMSLVTRVQSAPKVSILVSINLIVL